MPIPATQFIWFNGELVPWEKATVHVMTHALHYGSSVFEGCAPTRRPAWPSSACATTRAGCSTRPRSTASRCRSPPEQINEACRQVIAANGLKRGAYLRPIAFRGYGEIGVTPKHDRRPRS